MRNDKKIPFKREFSAGGCVYRKIKNQKSKIKIKEPAAHIDGGMVQYQWLIGKHSGYHKWVLPKGLIEEGEKGIETAVRETKEEMGVRGRVIGKKPVYKEQYWFVATLAKSEKRKAKNKPIRRVETYQEEPGFEESGAQKVRVLKTVSFYLMEYVSGDPKDHGWEMEAAEWCGFEEAMEKLAFRGEREALRKAKKQLDKEG